MTTHEDAAKTLGDPRLDYHRRQFERTYRSVVHLRQFVKLQLDDCKRPYRALDAACGAGANMVHLSTALPATTWTGVDFDSEVLSLGTELLARQSANQQRTEFVLGDILQLDTLLEPRSYDLAFSIQTLSWLPDYKRAMSVLLEMLRPGGVAFVTSLFTDFLVDAEILVTQLSDECAPIDPKPYHYNIYSVDRFIRHCLECGAQRVESVDFEIDLELAEPESRHMGTFTRRLIDGSLIQQSGPILMPWKFLAIHMGS